MKAWVRITLGVSISAWAALSGAQSVRQLQLGTAVARAAEPLSLVTTVRELKNGRLMVADPIERKLLVFDATLRSPRQLGREGSGPGEYRQPDGVWAFRGDSTLVLDLGNARLSVVSLDGTYGRSLPLSSGGPGAPPTAMFPGGTDALGGIYFAPRGMGPADSTNLMRADAMGANAKPVARLKAPEVDRQESGGADSRQVRVVPIPLSASDGWAVSPEGEVVVARAGNYHVEWLSAGATRRGAPVSVPRARIGDAEKKEWVNQQMLSGGISMQVQEENGERSVSFGRNRPQQEPNTAGYKWPAAKPPFDASTLRVDATGRLWVRRLRPAGEPVTYDVFGQDGGHQAVVTFPAGRTLLGFGATALYAADVDKDGQYTIERYAIPQ